MPDYVFFPIAALAAVAMVAFALAPGVMDPPSGSIGGADTEYERIVVEDSDLNRMIAGGGSVIRVEPGERGAIARVAVGKGPRAAIPTEAPHFRLAADIETQFAGFTIRVTIEAKSAELGGAAQFEAAYFATPRDASGWREFDFSAAPCPCVFEYRAPLQSADPSVDYLVIRPLGGGEIVVERVIFERLGRWAPVPAAT